MVDAILKSVCKISNMAVDVNTIYPVSVCLAFFFNQHFKPFGMDVIVLVVFVSNPVGCMDYSMLKNTTVCASFYYNCTLMCFPPRFF